MRKAAAIKGLAIMALAIATGGCAGGRPAADTGVRAVVEDETARQAAVRAAARGGDADDALKAAAGAQDRSKDEDRSQPR